ncbi:DUF5681 domain-containing protein [Thiorhodococcus minor]|uniref:DUF5681 domain-containing protein n=1 Tax=Thiorhodococcus minor TaxID=57489 RepID=A0A6M0K336_9GAMM|nr:hypothetical protein [Thiorhodococcus minor]
MAFKKGQSGNPKGRPKGIVCQAKLRAAILKDIPDIIETLVKAAKDGDTQAAKLLMDRSIPAIKPTSEPTTFKMGETLAESGQAILEAVATGKMSTDQGTALMQALAGLARVTEVTELEQRIAALEQATPKETPTP